MTTSASCSIEPDSLRSANTGLLSSRCSTALLNCERATIGIFNSYAIDLRPCVISEISLTLLSRLVEGLISCK